MRIDMDQIFAVMAHPPADVLSVDGKDYRLKRLSVLDVAALGTLQTPLTDETSEGHFERILKTVRSFFEGDAPAFLGEPRAGDVEGMALYIDRLIALVASVTALVVEGASMGNKVARVRTELMRQIETARSARAIG